MGNGDNRKYNNCGGGGGCMSKQATSVTFDSKRGSLRRLSDTCKHVLFEVCSHGLDETNSCGALPLPKRCRSYTYHNYVPVMVCGWGGCE